jgi:3-oxoacyl-[acyl-carrier protein] reductase
MTMNIDLRKKIVLVTGASGGLGAAISRELAGAGAAVAVHYHRGERAAEELAAEIGNGAHCFRADLGSPGGPGELFDAVVRHYNAIDVLVNNAGVFENSPIDRDRTAWLADWNAVIAINLTSVGVLCHAAVNHFRKRGGGRIINIASRAAFRGETEDYLAYAASKGGMVSLSRSIARSFGKHNITSFVIAPGLVRTRMIAGYLEKNDEADVVEREHALPALTEPRDIAPTVVFIAAGMMDHATGCTIDVNAGSYMR